jgi:hypothetical protein
MFQNFILLFSFVFIQFYLTVTSTLFGQETLVSNSSNPTLQKSTFEIIDSIQLRLRPLDSRKPSTDIMVSTFGEVVAIKYNHKDLIKLVRIVKSLPKCNEEITDESRPYFSIQIFYSNGQYEWITFFTTNGCDLSNQRGYFKYSPRLWRHIIKMTKEKWAKNEIKWALRNR